MEEARIAFLESIGCGYEKWEKDGIISPVININCDYKKPTTFGDELLIKAKIIEYKRLTLKVAYTMINIKTDEVVFVGESNHCFVNKEGRPIPLSRQFPEYDELLKCNVINEEF